MTKEQAKIDDNRRKALLGVTDDANEETRNLLVDPDTGRLKVSAIVGSGSLVSINADSTGAQTIALGSTGTDANIVDGGSGAHTIHLPTASTTNRGLLSKADWDAFDAKTDESLFNANTILKADSDDTPEALTVGEQTLVGRITAGEITALTATQVRTLISVEDGADVTDTANVTTAGALMDSEVDANLKTFVLPASTTISAFGASIVDDADATAVIATLNLDADIATLSLPASTTISAFGASIVDDADEATFKATVNLEIGTDVLAEQTIGIADDNLVEIDDADAADNDYAKFTANGLEGRSYEEVVNDIGAKLNTPRGFLLNGKIVPSVASDDLTVAIKGIDGNDPSASNPVYIRIGDTVRDITSALSVTLIDGLRMNLGSNELIDKEVDMFVYLGYNSTDGVVIGFCRFPYADSFDDFNTADSNNEKYCAISTITNAVATDYYTVIGRFATTLVTGNDWTVPAFTAKNLIQRPIYETRWLEWAPQWSASGGMTYTSVATHAYNYKISGSTLSFVLGGSGTIGGSASSAVIGTIPFTPIDLGGNYRRNGASSEGLGGFIYYRTATINFVKYDGSNWALGAAKTAYCESQCEI